MIAHVGDAAQALLVVVFAPAALTKALTVTDFTRVVERLGVWKAVARQTAIAAIAIEFGTAVCLAAFPSWMWPRVVVAVLALVFAAAGLAAVIARRQITCNCFGHLTHGALGWRQVELLPVWLALTAVAQWNPPTWGGPNGLLGLTFVLSGLVCWEATRERRLWREVQGERLAVVLPQRLEHTTSLRGL